MSELLILHTPTDKALTRLACDIEALSDRKPEFSKGPRTKNGYSYRVFCNGFPSWEGNRIRGRNDPLEDRISRTLKNVAAFRNEIDGASRLTWRILPEITELGDLYVRLCFEHCNRKRQTTTE